MNSKLKKEVGIIRSFNRYYTNVLGLLDQHILESDFTLSEVRVLHEIEKTEDCTSKKLAEILCMDSGYLSRILKQFQKYGLIEKRQSPEDGRSQFLYLTQNGQEKMDALNTRSDEQIYNLIQPLSEESQAKLVLNMASIENVLTEGKNIKPEDITIRHTIKPGDAGYITYMHGWIYKHEYNYTTAFEGYVAQSFFEFLLNYNANRDRLWIAEHNCEIIGCIGIVGRGDRAQLRWFLLHPNYRGLGLGKRLLNESLDFCREKGYKAVYLDTTQDLEKAIGMYTKAGFGKVGEKENHTWADHLMELEFEIKLEKPE
ncbi:helix-turn-helix domain-containing GNAT family N-acetyltransferase [Desulfosporosinus sp. PR]|uniref:bifunctional helix-turn-helix transcriptional regulator/GNAT family N-acetyltransferase n=1 Tax=Candidatus Desulfosporosinus nitrosoreducens TaxID=3401928 RepID=UPI0027EC9147|nr:helix-turn-helix domain-containing GNAT family N-acetyltransferase [Desulfosporosinus sp. PR]MDQ7096684.1 helix-turn-helix domain-containing GNAT family N-acetyltransferase [Desulfosporosinus sp. PR]